MSRCPRMSVDNALLFAKNHGFEIHEYPQEPADNEIMIDVKGFGELVELYYRRTDTGYWAFHHAFIHGGVGGDAYRTWKETQAQLRAIQNINEERSMS